MDVLLVEDEDPKRENIKSLLMSIRSNLKIEEARSVGSAIRCLRSTEFNLVILDMSLPTFDIGAGESGGRPQGFGGVEVLRYMDRLKIKVPVIIVTAYPAFAQGDKEIDLGSLSQNLKESHPNTFRYMVFYNSMFSTWKDELTKVTLELLALS